MAGLVLDGISKTFGDVKAVADVSLTIPNGEFVCLLGPSGCGKTTLLRMIAGLEQPDTGSIRLEGRDITATPAHERNFGMVFQSLALFPHLTVGENIAYSLKLRNIAPARRNARINELLEMVRLSGIADRHISQLSGGQRQRVAIARALALDPALFLLDEPLSALDAKLREAMQVELRQLQQQLGITTIVVTHDQREAMTMSDTVVVMGENHIQQVGSPLDIYRTPRTTFVADFIGLSNLLQGRVDSEDRVQLDSGSVRVAVLPDGARSGMAVTLSVRPENVHLLPATDVGNNRLPGTVRFIRDIGASVETYVDCNGTEVISIASPKDRADIAVGDPVLVELPVADCVVLEA